MDWGKNERIIGIIQLILDAIGSGYALEGRGGVTAVKGGVDAFAEGCDFAIPDHA